MEWWHRWVGDAPRCPAALDSRLRGNDGEGGGSDVAVMRRDISLFCRKTGPGRLEIRRRRLYETGSGAARVPGCGAALLGRFADDARLQQVRYLPVAEAMLPQHLLCVLAEQRSGAPDCAWALRKLHRDADGPDAPNRRMVQLHNPCHGPGRGGPGIPGPCYSGGRLARPPLPAWAANSRRAWSAASSPAPRPAPRSSGGAGGRSQSAGPLSAPPGPMA